MKTNLIFKILSSLPVILIMLYFIPFLGICLTLLRCFMYKEKRNSTQMTMILFGVLVLIPKVLYLILDVANLDINIPYLNDIFNSELYSVNFINYSKFLICVGVILLIISYIFKSISDRLSSGVTNYINKIEERDAEISRKNDIEIKTKQERARNTSHVKCPSCGSDNLLGEKFGTCKYCRRKIQNKNYK